MKLDSFTQGMIGFGIIISGMFSIGIVLMLDLTMSLKLIIPLSLVSIGGFLTLTSIDDIFHLDDKQSIGDVKS